MTWLNFDNPQSSSKKWPKKIKMPQMKFFLKKQLIKFSCNYEPLSFCKISKKFLQPNQSYEDNSFLGPFIQNNFFLVQTIIITFIYLLALSIVQNFKNILTAYPEFWECANFGPKMVICSKQNIFWEMLLISFSSTYWSLSLCKILKSDINLLMKYWRLNNTEISLAESHFWL